jgi:hypothetical protein
MVCGLKTVVPAQAGIHTEPAKSATRGFANRQRQAVAFLPTQKYKVEKEV